MQGLDLEQSVMRRCLNQLERLPTLARIRVAQYLVSVANDHTLETGDILREPYRDPRQLTLRGTEGDEIP